MFDILEADIVVMQEAKIQRKDLTDDMVLVNGWDVFFSLPRDKKGKSSNWLSHRARQCLLTLLHRLLRCRHLHEELQMLPRPS